jgi:hypothetical protein
MKYRLRWWLDAKRFEVWYWIGMRLPKSLVRLALYRAGWTLMLGDEHVPDVPFVEVLRRA